MKRTPNLSRVMALGVLGSALVAAGAAAPAVRVVAVQPRVDLAYCATYQSYHDHLLKLVEAEVTPRLAHGQPNVVVFPEDVGLPAVFIGSRGAAARTMTSVTDAYGALFAGNPPPYGKALYYYHAAMPNLPLDRLAALAVTDTAWRAFYLTMREVAVTTGAYIIASTNISGKVEVSTDPTTVYLLNDPDLPMGYVFVARDPEVYNTAFVFAPNGAIIGAARKPYITDLEESLKFSYGSISDVAPLDLGFAKFGIATCKDGWMPDVMDRLDMMGANVLLQPTGFGGWCIPDHPAHPEVWKADIFAQSAWQDVMKYGSIRFGATSHLTGNLFNLPFDGQSAFFFDPIPGVTAWGYVGQDPIPGLDAIAPWVAPDPGIADPALTLAERRDQLRQVGISLLPGFPNQNAYVETAVSSDLPVTSPYPTVPGVKATGLPASAPVAHFGTGEQSYAAVGTDGAGLVVVAWQDTRHGRQQVYVAVSRNGGKKFEPALRISPSASPQRTPSVTVSPAGVFVAWQEERSGARRILVARAATNGRAFSAPIALPTADPADEWCPKLAWGWNSQGRKPKSCVYLAFVATQSGNERVMVARTADAGASWAVVPADSTPLPYPSPNIRNNQWSPAIAVKNRNVAVAWVDFSSYAWDVRVARSADGGVTFAAPVRADDGGTTFERIHNNPDIAYAEDGSLMVGWTDIRDRSPVSTARVAKVLATFGGSTILASTAQPADSSWMPRVVSLGHGRTLTVWQDFRTHGNDIMAAFSDDGGATFAPEVRVDDGGDGISYQHAPAAVAIRQHQAFVVWEDTRTGLRQLRYAIVR